MRQTIAADDGRTLGLFGLHVAENKYLCSDFTDEVLRSIFYLLLVCRQKNVADDPFTSSAQTENRSCR